MKISRTHHRTKDGIIKRNPIQNRREKPFTDWETAADYLNVVYGYQDVENDEDYTPKEILKLANSKWGDSPKDDMEWKKARKTAVWMPKHACPMCRERPCKTPTECEEEYNN